ncbi:helix-turn-helix domain-containing protein [Allocoleopsis franciscana]|uniref:Putative transcription regulator containing HTH domain n=1 Tax=Allocoleopsis franciscana PCC 7113 TaxID=1173027 RepID=K9WD05_9CYAN|nr:transcription regulator containing HTH domain [Allocoleopsis franciscana]AFZ18290.1 putative transcription regulator containing HTH domain [Allocoleopsis franciscana PCC 7113]
MTLIFNSDKYRELLIKYQPKLIRTEEENERALTTVKELMNRPNRSLEENELYDLLITLIEKFEREFYSPGKASTPHSMVAFLMEQQNIKPEDLVGTIGDEEVVAEVIQGKRVITQEQAKTVGKMFKVDPSLFIRQDEID